MSHYDEQFLKRTPLAVLQVLRSLQRSQIAIRLSWPGGQFISKVLEVDAEHMLIDFGSQQHENQMIQQAEKITVSAETAGAKVEFTLPPLSAVGYQSLPAFRSALPASLWFIQRREHFRISAPIQPRYFCRATLADNAPFVFRLCDLSLGGMGALVDGELPASLAEGMLFSRAKVDLAQWGTFYIDMMLVTISERRVVDSKNETIITPRLSLRFVNMNAAHQRELQKVIFGLERVAHEKANRFN